MVKRNVKLGKPSQKQKQTQIVNINLGRIGGKKRKSKPKKKGKEEIKQSIIPAFNPPPIINFPPGFMPKSMADANQPNYFNRPPPPPPLKETAAFVEGETAGVLNLNPTIPVPFSFIGAEERLKAPAKEERLSEVILPAEPPEEDDISTLTEAPEFVNLPEESAGQILDLPPVEASVLLENKEPLFDPFNLEVPATSGRSLAPESLVPESLASEEAPSTIYTPVFSEVGTTFAKRRPPLLPPVKLEPENIGLSLPPIFSSGLSVVPPIAPTKVSFGTEPAAEAPKKGRPKGKKNRPKEVIEEERLQREENLTSKTKSAEEKAFIKAQKEREAGQQFLGFETTKGSFPYLQLEAGLGPEVLKSRPIKEVGGLERRRGGGVLTAAEEAIIGGTPAFLA